MTDMQFKLLVILIDDSLVDVVLDEARRAGATGATIVPYARGQGRERAFTFFGIEYLHSRSILMILVEARRFTDVLEAVTRAGRLDESVETGIAIELDVSRATGLSEHVRVVAEQHPVKP